MQNGRDDGFRQVDRFTSLKLRPNSNQQSYRQGAPARGRSYLLYVGATGAKSTSFAKIWRFR